MPINEYFCKMASAVTKWSENFTHCKQISIDLPLWTSAVQWNSAEVKVKKKEVPGFGTEYLIPAGRKPYPRSDKNYRASSWGSWKLFTERSSVLYSLFLPSDNWQKGTCTCRIFLKDFICHHIVGLAIKNGLAVAPPTASQIPLGKTRGQGRPCKVKPALSRD